MTENRASSFWCCGGGHASQASEHHFTSIKAQYYQAIKECNLSKAGVLREAAHRDALTVQSDELRHARITEDKILTRVFGEAQKAMPGQCQGNEVSGGSPPGTPQASLRSSQGTIGLRDVELVPGLSLAISAQNLHWPPIESLWDRQGRSLAQALSNEETRLTSLQLASDRANLAVNMLASAMSKANLARIRLSDACEKSCHGAIPGSVGEWLLRQEGGSSRGARGKGEKISTAKSILSISGLTRGLSLISEAAGEGSDRLEGRTSVSSTGSKTRGLSPASIRGLSPASSTARVGLKATLPPLLAPLLRLSNKDMARERAREVEISASSSRSAGLMKVLVQPVKSSVDLRSYITQKNLQSLSFEQAGFQPRSSIDDPRPASRSSSINESSPRASATPKRNSDVLSLHPTPLSPTRQEIHGENEVSDEDDLLSKLGKGVELPAESQELAKQGAYDAMAAFNDYSSAQHLVQTLEGKASQEPQLLLQLRPSFSKLLEPQRDGKRQRITSMDASLANRYLLAILELAGHIELSAKSLAMKADSADEKLEVCKGAVSAGRHRLRVHQRDVLLKLALSHMHDARP